MYPHHLLTSGSKNEEGRTSGTISVMEGGTEIAIFAIKDTAQVKKKT